MFFPSPWNCIAPIPGLEGWLGLYPESTILSDLYVCSGQVAQDWAVNQETKTVEFFHSSGSRSGSQVESPVLY